MNLEFHYYATFTAAYIAGYSIDDAIEIANSAAFVDFCSKPLLEKCGANKNAATVQSQSELLDATGTLTGFQEMTKVWSSFHFLPGNLDVKIKAGKAYLHKYQMICFPNGNLLKETLDLVKNTNLEAVGLSMHVLADTWAHQNFAGCASLVINDTNDYFYEIIEKDGKEERRKIHFAHSLNGNDNPETSTYTNTLRSNAELSIMNLGHGRVGHLPDYSFIKYCYLPAWGNYNVMTKDNPSDYMKAFKQMVYAMTCLREGNEFNLNTYDEEKVKPYEERLHNLFIKRQISSMEDWKILSKEITGSEIIPFNLTYFTDEYNNKENKEDTKLNNFVNAAINQKTMLTNELFSRGNLLAGFPQKFVFRRKKKANKGENK